MAGQFREDLFYRLAVAKLAIAAAARAPRRHPAARPSTSWTSTAARLGTRGRAGVPVLTEAAERALLSHLWMGNIRELENAIHHALLVSRGGEIAPEDLPLIKLPPRRTTGPLPTLEALTPPPSLPAAPPADPRAVLRSALKTLYDEGSPALWDEIEEIVMLSAYEHSLQNQLRTARLLGVSRNVVRARLLQFGVLTSGSARESDDEPLLSGGGLTPPADAAVAPWGQPALATAARR